MLFWVSLIIILGIIGLIPYALKSHAKSLASVKHKMQSSDKSLKGGHFSSLASTWSMDNTKSRKKMFNKNILYPGEPRREKVQGTCPICNLSFQHAEELYRCPKCKLVAHMFHIKERKKCLCNAPWIICDKVGVMNILNNLLQEEETDSTELAEWEAARKRVATFFTGSEE